MVLHAVLLVEGLARLPRRVRHREPERLGKLLLELLEQGPLADAGGAADHEGARHRGAGVGGAVSAKEGPSSGRRNWNVIEIL